MCFFCHKRQVYKLIQNLRELKLSDSKGGENTTRIQMTRKVQITRGKIDCDITLIHKIVIVIKSSHRNITTETSLFLTYFFKIPLSLFADVIRFHVCFGEFNQHFFLSLHSEFKAGFHIYWDIISICSCSKGQLQKNDPKNLLVWLELKILFVF